MSIIPKSIEDVVTERETLRLALEKEVNKHEGWIKMYASFKEAYHRNFEIGIYGMNNKGHVLRYENALIGYLESLLSD